MCMSQPKAPPPIPPMPAQAPPTAPVLEKSGRGSAQASLAAGRGRDRLRIDRTQNVPGAAGSGLNIPS